MQYSTNIVDLYRRQFCDGHNILVFKYSEFLKCVVVFFYIFVKMGSLADMIKPQLWPSEQNILFIKGIMRI